MQAWLDKVKSQWLDGQIGKKFAPLVFLLLILYVCWRLASLFWLIVAPPQVLQTQNVMLGSKQSQVPNIGQFSLFYEASQSNSMQDNQLPLSLKGVMVADSAQFSSAVIQLADKTDRYRVGETIEGSSYQLAEVSWDQVVLRQNNGSTRILAFQGMENGLDHSLVNPQQAAVNNSNSMQRPVASVDQHLGQATQQLQENRDQYIQSMGLQASGEGYEISHRTPVALRNKLGLQPGDRIVSLNGQTLAAGQTEAQLLEQARQQGQVRLEIKRGDQTMTVQQDFK